MAPDGLHPSGKGLERRTPLRADPAAVRAWQDRSRQPLPRESKRRRLDAVARAKVRVAVIARDARCIAKARGAPGSCRFSPDYPNYDVHEVVPRGRGGDWLDPENCIAVCRGHHEWITQHPTEATALGLLASHPPGG